MMCFLPVFSFRIKRESRLHNTKGATAFTSCTSIISGVSISPNLNLQLLVFRKSTCCKSASNCPSGKTSLVDNEVSKLYGICDNFADARIPIPGSGACQVTAKVLFCWLEVFLPSVFNSFKQYK